MLKKLFYLATAVVLLFLQVHPFLPFGRTGIRPDLMFILVVYTGVCCSVLSGAALCFVLGYLVEIFSGSSPGFYITVYLCAFISIRFFLKYFSFDSLTKLSVLLLVCFGIKFSLLLFSFYFTYSYDFYVFRKIFFLEAFATFILSPFVFWVLRIIENYKKETPYFFGSGKHVV